MQETKIQIPEFDKTDKENIEYWYGHIIGYQGNTSSEDFDEEKMLFRADQWRRILNHVLRSPK